jgi:hypothetical protein
MMHEQKLEMLEEWQISQLSQKRLSFITTSLAPYIKLPSDPLNTGSAPWAGGYIYTYGNVGRTAYREQYDLTALLETASPYRCAIKQYNYFFNNTPWCGSYSGQIYEASPN